MYEQVSHSLLNTILSELSPSIEKEDLRHFFTRLGANFYSIHSIFSLLYGDRDDFQMQMPRLVDTLARLYIRRPQALRQVDLDRERDDHGLTPATI